MSWQQNEKKEKFLYTVFRKKKKTLCVLDMVRIRLLKVDDM